MPGLRSRVAWLAARSGALSVVRATRRVWLRDVRLLAYHRVLPRMDEAGYPFDPGLISAWQDDFDWQMRYVARQFDVLTCRDVAAAVDGGSRLPARPLVVTFDDGFADNYEVAFPILRANAVPATIFLATDLIGGGVTFWFERLAYIVLRTPLRELALAGRAEPLRLGSTLPQRRAAVVEVLRHAKSLLDSQRVALVEGLAHTANAPLAAEHQRLSRPLQWAQVRAMAAAGIEFGSHTASHPVLARLESEAAIDHELQSSKARIEAELKQAVVSLAYPVGGAKAVDVRVLHAVARAGYQIAVTYRPGTNSLRAWNRFELRRIAVESYVSRDKFRALVEAPELFLRREPPVH